jgi:ubiquinone/menaquinone biosynthesis C-methylase UbiE
VGFYERCILPHLLNLAMTTEGVRAERTRCLADVTGTVLEIGFGSGLNLPFYSSAVTKVVGIDPSATAAKLARARIAAAPFAVEVMGLSAETIPAADASFDNVVSTFTLCTIPDPARALSEMRRVLRPGGRLVFVEHGLSDDAGVQRWQQRLNGVQQMVFGGCHLNRPISTLIAQAGFEVTHLEHAYMKGAPRFAGFLYRGTGVRS